MKNILGHLKKIIIHKWWVFVYSCKLGIPIQGLLHDLSKFHPTEFFESVRYYQGNKSPIPVAKKENGYSKAWQHHKGVNKHHYEYWIDNNDDELVLIPIPFKYVLELLADWYGAARAYNGPDFNYLDELKWWIEKEPKITYMHPATKILISRMIKHIEAKGFDFNMKEWNNTYNNIISDIKNAEQK